MAHATRANPSGFWWTKGVLILGSIALLLPVIGIMNVADVNLGTQNIWTTSMFAGTVLQPAAAILSLLLAIDAWRRGAGPWLRLYALKVSLCSCVLTAYLSYWGMVAFRPWSG